jgi:hypothetical protein
MTNIRKYVFQYRYFTNLSSFNGILDGKKKNSEISLNRLKKHQINTKNLIQRLTKTSYNNDEDQYKGINYDDIEGIIMDFHILLGDEKIGITLKKVLVLKYIEDEYEDERFGFILGNDFMKEFDVGFDNIRGKKGKRLLRRLKFTIQLNEIDEINEVDDIYDNFDSKNIYTLYF